MENNLVRLEHRITTGEEAEGNAGLVVKSQLMKDLLYKA